MGDEFGVHPQLAGFQAAITGLRKNLGTECIS
jgi:hypothetical protein